MSGGRGYSLVYLSEGSHWWSSKDGPTSLSTTVIPPLGSCLLVPEACACCMPEDGCSLTGLWFRDKNLQDHALAVREGDSLVEILSLVYTTCSLLSVPAVRKCQVFSSGSFRRALVFDTNVLPAHMQNTALKKEKRGRKLWINPEAGFLLTSSSFSLAPCL